VDVKEGTLLYAETALPPPAKIVSTAAASDCICDAPLGGSVESGYGMPEMVLGTQAPRAQ
jgi:hypothetical protein